MFSGMGGGRASIGGDSPELTPTNGSLALLGGVVVAGAEEADQIRAREPAAPGLASLLCTT